MLLDAFLETPSNTSVLEDMQDTLSDLLCAASLKKGHAIEDKW